VLKLSDVQLEEIDELKIEEIALRGLRESGARLSEDIEDEIIDDTIYWVETLDLEGEEQITGLVKLLITCQRFSEDFFATPEATNILEIELMDGSQKLFLLIQLAESRLEDKGQSLG